MAKTATDIPITQGSGVNLSNFALANGRRRQTVILGDADAAGEALVAEFPIHGDPDRGSALKIGGRAQQDAFTSVDEGDRVDAWFSASGELGTISTHESAVVYDKGRRSILTKSIAGVQANASVVIVAAVPAMKIKVVSLVVSATNLTTPGTVTIHDSVETYFIGQLTATGTQFNFMNGGQLIYATGVNLPLNGLYLTGTCNVAWSVTYYLAP